MKKEQLKNAIEKIDDKYISGAEYFDPETMKISKSPLIYIVPAAAVAASVIILVASNHFNDINDVSDNFEVDNNFQVSCITTVSECSASQTVKNIGTVISSGNKSDRVSEIISAGSDPYVSIAHSHDNVVLNVNDTSKNEGTSCSAISSEKTDKPDFTEISVITDAGITRVSLSTAPVLPEQPPATEPFEEPPSEEPPSHKPSASTTNENNPAPIDQAQPLPYGNYGEITYAVYNYDLSEYPDIYQDSYRTMFERIKSDGFIYAVDASSDSQISLSDRNITLFPYARYEDIGIGCYAEYNNSLFQVMIHYTDKRISDLESGQIDYFEKRLGVKFNQIYTINDNVVFVRISGDGICAYSYIDDDHYYIIRTAASRDDLISFLRSFSLKKISLK